MRRRVARFGNFHAHGSLHRFVLLASTVVVFPGFGAFGGAVVCLFRLLRFSDWVIFLQFTNVNKLAFCDVACRVIYFKQLLLLLSLTVFSLSLSLSIFFVVRSDSSGLFPHWFAFVRFVVYVEVGILQHCVNRFFACFLFFFFLLLLFSRFIFKLSARSIYRCVNQEWNRFTLGRTAKSVCTFGGFQPFDSLITCQQPMDRSLLLEKKRASLFPAPLRNGRGTE